MSTYRVMIIEELVDGVLGQHVVSESGVVGFVFCGVSGIRTQSHSDRVHVDNCRICVEGTALGTIQAFIALHAQMMQHQTVRREVARSQQEGATSVAKPMVPVDIPCGTLPDSRKSDSEKLEASIMRLSESLTDIPSVLAADIANVLAELKKHGTFPPAAALPNSCRLS